MFTDNYSNRKSLKVEWVLDHERKIGPSKGISGKAK